jgi:hypothetical protein
MSGLDLLAKAVEIQGGGAIPCMTGLVLEGLQGGRGWSRRPEDALTRNERVMQASAIIGKAHLLQEPGRTAILAKVGVIHPATALVALTEQLDPPPDTRKGVQRVVKHWLTGQRGRGRPSVNDGHTLRQLDAWVNEAADRLSAQFPRRVF